MADIPMRQSGTVTGNITSTEGSYYEEEIGTININNAFRTIYRRIIYCGNFSGTKTVSTSIPITKQILSVSGVMRQNNNSGAVYPIPYVTYNTPATNLVGLNLNNDGTNYTAVMFNNDGLTKYNCYITVEYC